MSTPRRAARTMPRTASADYQRLEELRRQHREEFKARLGQLREALTQADAVEVNDNEALCDSSSSAGISAAVVEITSRTLQGIEGALDRLERGTYGQVLRLRSGDTGHTAASRAFRRKVPGLPGAGRRRSQRARRVTGRPLARPSSTPLRSGRGAGHIDRRRTLPDRADEADVGIGRGHVAAGVVRVRHEVETQHAPGLLAGNEPGEVGSKVVLLLDPRSPTLARLDHEAGGTRFEQQRDDRGLLVERRPERQRACPDVRDFVGVAAPSRLDDAPRASRRNRRAGRGSARRAGRSPCRRSPPGRASATRDVEPRTRRPAWPCLGRPRGA